MMDPWQIALVLLLLAIALPQLIRARQSDPRQLARLEAKLDLVMQHLGLQSDLQLTIPDEVQRLVRAGKPVDAMRSLRQASPWIDLRQAKAYVDRLTP